MASTGCADFSGSVGSTFAPMATSSRPYTADYVVQLVERLYFKPECTALASQELTCFQTSANAFDISVFLLVRCAPVAPDASSFLSAVPLDAQTEPLVAKAIDASLQSVVAFFAAQTLCTLSQAGYQGQGESAYITAAAQLTGNMQEDDSSLTRRLLTELLWVYRDISPSTAPVVRQLTQAVIASVIFSFSDAFVAHKQQVHASAAMPLAIASGSAILSEFIERYTQVDTLYPACLQILSALPTDVSHNKKIALTSDQRERMSVVLLHHIFHVFDSVSKIYDSGLHALMSAYPTRSSLTVYVSIYSRWMFSAPPELYQQLSLSHIANCLNDVFWYRDQLQQLFTPDALQKDAHQHDPLGSLQTLILNCFHSWLEALTRYRRRLGEPRENATQDIITALAVNDTYSDHLGTILHDAGILLRSRVVPVALFNLVYAAHCLLAEAPTRLSSSLPDARDLSLVVAIADVNEQPVSCSASTILRVACDTVVELLELIYVMHCAPPLSCHAGEQCDEELGPLLSLLNWTNFEPLMCICYALIHLGRSIRAFCGSEERFETRNGSRCTASRRISVDQLLRVPVEMLRVFLTLFDSCAKIFLPALTYSIENQLFDPSDFQTPDSFRPCAEILAFMSSPSEQRTFLLGIQSLMDLMLDLLYHPCLELRHLVLGVWYSLVGNQYFLQQMQLQSAQDSATLELLSQDQKLLITNNTTAASQTPPYPMAIVPTFNTLIDCILDAAGYPENITEIQSTFPFTAWIKFRDECVSCLADSTAILTSTAIIDKVGGTLLDFLRQLDLATKEKPSTFAALYRKIEVCLFVFSAVLPRAQVNVDPYIPSTLEMLPGLACVQGSALEQTILRVGSASFMLWAAGYIGTRRSLFASCFRLAQSYLCALVPCLEKPVSPDHDTELSSFWVYAERVIIETLNTLVAASAPVLTLDVMAPESDITFVLTALADSVLMAPLSMESRCSLIVSAGALLQCLSFDKMQKYHYQLAKALESRVLPHLPPSSSSTRLSPRVIDALKLFFTALECVRPIRPVCAPPFSPHAVPLDPTSEYRHPVLNIVEEFWVLFERCLLDFHQYEVLIEAVCHCVTHTFSPYPAHVVRYAIFQRFLECLAESFRRTPSVHHLAALRTMLGVFGWHREEPVLQALNNCVLTCTGFIMNAMNGAGFRQFVRQSPDLVGMTIDCNNAVLQSPFLTLRILDHPSFADLCTLTIKLTPESHHPKVLMTLLLFISRFVAWLDSNKLKLKENQSTLLRTKDLTEQQQHDVLPPPPIAACSEKAESFCDRLQLVPKILTAIVRTLTEQFHGNTQWTGIIASIFFDLLSSPHYVHQVRNDALRALLEHYCPRKNAATPPMMLNAFYATLFDETLTHPALCRALQRFADECETQWQQQKFSSKAE